MGNQKKHSGTNQNDRLLTALQPDYVSVEERSTADLLKYLREYAKKVRFYNEANRFDGFWSSFLDFSDDEISELAQFADNPMIFRDDTKRFSKYARPHLAVLLTFLKLLQYPKEKFAQLTWKKAGYFYRNVLQLVEQAEVPDQVHVVFRLAQDVREHLLKKGTLLSAGKDATGLDLHYEVTEDIVLNNAEVSDIKTIHFTKTTTDIKYVHVSNDKGDAGFEKILCLSLGNISNLPPYITDYGREIPVDAKYLRTELYKRIKGKEKDALTAGDANYIFNALCFRFLKDFRYCLDLLYREMNRGYIGVTYPEDPEWEKAYTILEGVHRERLARTRRGQLKAIHRDYGFESLMEFAFGEPEPWNMLYKMPGNISTLADLAAAQNEAARQYIESKLCMSATDFKVIMDKKDIALGSMAADEVYTLLETAWTKKRDYKYPEIGAEVITGYYADTVFSADKDRAVTRFQPFGKKTQAASPETINMGFAVSSPLLRLHEGTRIIELVITCKEGTISYEKLAALLTTKIKNIFTIYLSTSNGWYPADRTSFESGSFIKKPELKKYSNETSCLVCSTVKYPVLETAMGGYIVFANGNANAIGKVYQIIRFDEEYSRILLKSVALEFPAANTTLIRRLIPKTFVEELPAQLDLTAFYSGIATSPRETFADYYQGKYLIDSHGYIFYIKKFIDAKQAELSYCGALSATTPDGVDENDRLLIGKVWEFIEPEYEAAGSGNAISGLAISGIYAADDRFTFEISDGLLKISYPVGAKSSDLWTAWEAWKDNPWNRPGRWELKRPGNDAWLLEPVTKNIEETGEIIKRYELTAANGIRITYQGRPTDIAGLTISDPSPDTDRAGFLIVDGILVVTPGRVSQTTNQIAADWLSWSKTNDPKGFQIESKDEHLWKAVKVSELELNLTNKRIKKCEICNLYGEGIRVLYNGSEADLPQIIIKENMVDLFEFEVTEGPQLTVKYPSSSVTTAFELMKAWQEWKNSVVNDPGNFTIEQMGDGFWTVLAQTELKLQASLHGVIECDMVNVQNNAGIGVTARYQLSAAYQNAIVEFIPDQTITGFRFAFSQETDALHKNIPVKKLTIRCQPLPVNTDEAQILHVQTMLSQWNRIYDKQGFSLLRSDVNAKWALDFPGANPLTINFLDQLNYICVADPNGFLVKYTPNPGSSLTESKVVIHENDADAFAFHLTNDYQSGQKILFIKYPVTKKNRTVAELLKAWDSLDQDLKDTFNEFRLAQSGTGKWEITGVTVAELTGSPVYETRFGDPVTQQFYEYKTDDINGFSVAYTDITGVVPQLTIAENNNDSFEFEVTFADKTAYSLEVGSSLTIKYPQRTDKRRVIDLLCAWDNYKKSVSAANRILGFEIFDTSAVINKRSKSQLLFTGDKVREYMAGGGSGIGITYTGHRDDPAIEFTPIIDFDDTVPGKMMLWDNGEVFTITGKLDRNNVFTGPDTRHIPYLGAIKLYEPDAVCLDGLKFTIYLEGDFPEVVPLPGEGFSAEPAVKILLNNNTKATGQADDDVNFYECLKSVEMRRIDLKVAVNGLTDIKMRGNLSMINPANPFQPFGMAPDAPARFYFANPEICEKKLDSLRISFDWMENMFVAADGLPDMERYYYTYSHCGLEQLGTVHQEDFEVTLQFLDRRIWVPISQTPATLFGYGLKYHNFERQTYQGNLFTEGADIPKDPLDWARYYKMELSNQGFMKDLYQNLLNEIIQATNRMAIAQNNYSIIKQEIKTREEQLKAAKLAEAEAREKGEPFSPPVLPEARALPVLPENDRDICNQNLNPPYTPTIRSMSIDYSASAGLRLDTAAATTDITEVPVQLFRFHPFGFEEIFQPDETGAVADGEEFLLPQYDQEGYLFVGITNAAPLQNVSLLFQMVSGSGDAKLAMPGISWSYLVSNQWLPFKAAEILTDKTYGLENTGVIKFSIPAEATVSNTILPEGRLWIRAAASRNIAAVPDILDIRAESISVTYRNLNNDPDHLSTPLASYTIKEMDERDPAIREIIQPYTSFNGRRREQGIDYFVRVSERLKHKNRALTPDDYEKMILARFPQVYKVKCVPQDERALISAELIAPDARGEIIIIVILKNSNATPFFPLKPKTPANILADIKQYILCFMPPLVNVTVINPRFEEIRYRLAVKFNKGYDRGYCINLLNEDIKRFLSPWAYDNKAEISFGSAVYSSTVINFIENAEYVDYVANFSLLQQIIQHQDYTEIIPLFLTEDNVAAAQYPDSILVSAESHIIDVITTETYDPGAFSGIGYLQIGSDFWIARPGPVFAVGIGEMELETWPVLRYAFTGFKVVIIVKMDGSADQTELETCFSREDSQKIWNIIKDSKYLDNLGNVLSKIDYYADNPPLTVNIDNYEQSFGEYLESNLAQFQFQIIRTADLGDGVQVEHSVDQALRFKDTVSITRNVIDILRNGLDFDGMSQFPFMVY